MAYERNVEEKRKLVRCWMVNPAGEGRWRFVELEAFRLWEYVMTHKHGMTIHTLSMCLWVPDSLFQQNSAMFKEAGTVTPVNQVTIERYDPNYLAASTSATATERSAPSRCGSSHLAAPATLGDHRG